MLSLGVFKMAGPGSSDFHYPVRSFPIGVELSFRRIDYGGNDLSENQVTDHVPLRLDPSIVVLLCPPLVVVVPHACCLSSFFQQVEVSSSFEVILLGIIIAHPVSMNISTGIIVSVLYFKLNCISPIGVHAIVRYAHRTFSTSSAHAPFLLSSFHFQYIDYGAVGDFNLSIGLRVCRRREMMLDTELVTELFEKVIIKLAAIV